MAPTAGTRLRFKKSAQGKKKKPVGHGKKKAPSLKNRIRNITRLLQQNKNITAGVRHEKEKELEELKRQVEGKETAEKEKEMAVKYKRNKFYERKKLMRKLQHAKTQLNQTEEKSEQKKLKSEIKNIKNDLKYVFYFPKGEKYLSLFPSQPLNDEQLNSQMRFKEAAKEQYKEHKKEKAKQIDDFKEFCEPTGKNVPVRKVHTTDREEQEKKKLEQKKLERRRKLDLIESEVQNDDDLSAEEDDFFL